MIKVKTMLIKEMYITFNLLRAIFGVNHRCLRNTEIVHRTENTMIIHLASTSRCREILSVDGVRLTERITADKKYNWCGKVVIKCRSSMRTMVFYILDEGKELMDCISLGGREISLWKPMFNMTRDYCFGECNEITRYNYITPSINQYDILEYQPVRIVISKFGHNNFRRVGHRFIVSREGNNIIDIDCTCKLYLFYFITNFIHC